uniref:Uncharacterized protein n=1 Tax=Nelumbo nucifera TaxID=4432 RepID=A0A822Z352_NELNU|nr:TPA_asm: hypothetical protein HUJ06_008520 [Nelumbo nucifera]
MNGPIWKEKVQKERHGKTRWPVEKKRWEEEKKVWNPRWIRRGARPRPRLGWHRYRTPVEPSMESRRRLPEQQEMKNLTVLLALFSPSTRPPASKVTL